MKLSIITLNLLLVSTHSVLGQTCSGPAPLEYQAEKAFRVEKVGTVPAANTDPFTYNMYAADNFDGDVMYFLDQKEGLIFSYDSYYEKVKKIFDKNTSPIPSGLDLNWTYGSAGQEFRVKNMSQGPTSNTVIVVFNSATLPTGWNEADAKLPAPGAFGKAVCEEYEWIEDIYRVGTVPACFQNGAGLVTRTNYDVFYKYKIVNGELTEPVPFFVAEVSVTPGHLGGGLATLPDGSILWSPGDCTIFGVDGHYAPQLDSEWCGKIHMISTDKVGNYRTVAKGVRNPQQIRLFRPRNNRKAKVGEVSMQHQYHVAFMDIGGVTAEEINNVKLLKLLKKNKIENFGWGRNQQDGMAREGTFYVNPGVGGVLGTEPSCKADAPLDEEGYIQPWIQFGRTETDFFHAISSLALPQRKVVTVKLMWTEFNTGIMMGTPFIFRENPGPETAFKYRLFDNKGNELADLNDLVKEELGEVGYYRGDARLFHYPNGSPGAFIERTGAFYKLTEIDIPTRSTRAPTESPTAVPTAGVVLTESPTAGVVPADDPSAAPSAGVVLTESPTAGVVPADDPTAAPSANVVLTESPTAGVVPADDPTAAPSAGVGY